MSNKKKWIIGIATSVLALAVGGAAYAGGGGGGFCGMGHGGHMVRLFRALDLTDGQQDMAMDIKHDVKKRMIQTRRESRGHMDQTIGELEKAKPDVARLHQLVDDRVEAFKKNAHYAVDRMMELHQTLTPEQRANLRAQAERMRDHHHKGKRWE